jgi:hypothetical protein
VPAPRHVAERLAALDREHLVVGPVEDDALAQGHA